GAQPTTVVDHHWLAYRSIDLRDPLCQPGDEVELGPATDLGLGVDVDVGRRLEELGPRQFDIAVHEYVFPRHLYIVEDDEAVVLVEPAGQWIVVRRHGLC